MIKLFQEFLYLHLPLLHGGVQEETTMLDVPCLTVRPNTERPITTTSGTSQLVEPTDIVAKAAEILSGAYVAPVERPPLWDGAAGPRIAAVLSEWVGA